MLIRPAVASDETVLRETLPGNDLDQRIAAGEVLVLERDDVGVLAHAVVDRTFFGRPFVHRLFVHPGHRRQGWGGRLLADVVERQSARVFTSTNLSNASMHALLLTSQWEACGFVHGLDEGDPEVFYFRDPV